MAPVKRWLEWAGGAVKVSLDGHQRSTVRHSDMRGNMPWKWMRPAAMSALPWCPFCGVILPPDAHKYRGETPREIHYKVCPGMEDVPDEEQPEDDLLQLEEKQDDPKEIEA